MVGWDHGDPADVSVLHVDDDEAILDLTQRFLERLDDRFDVTPVVGALAGLDALAEHEFDCIVSDYQMPDLDGLEFLERVRDDHPDLPFVLFTGEGSETVASDAIAAGATDYVPKGAGTDSFEVLSNRVSNAVEGYHAERELERTAERFRGLAQAAPVPIGVIGADGAIRYVNDASVDFFEAESASEVLGRQATAYIHPTDRERAADRIQRVLRDRESPPAVETRFVTSSDDVKLGMVSAAPVEYDGEPASQVVVNDVTEERKAKDELARQEQFTGSLLDALDGLFFVFEVDDGLVQWNGRVNEVTGYDDEELAGMTAEEFTPESSLDRTKEAVEAVNDGESTRYDGAVETRDGDVVDYEFNVTSYETADASYRVGIAHDITDRVERERRLRERTGELETIVGNFPVILFVVDEDGVFTRSTGVALDELGLEPGEVEGERIQDVYADRRDVLEHFERALDGESVNATVSIAGRTFDTWYEPVEGDDGVTKVVGASFDVTDRVEDRRKVEEKNARLEEFASVVTHDLRNPLGVARGAFELVAEESDESIVEQVETVRSAHGRMDRIIDDVLALARGDLDLDVRPVSGETVLTEAVSNVETASADVTVSYDEVVLADRGSLARIVENLVRNSVEHGSTGNRAEPDDSVEHGGTDVVVRGLADGEGFYVADDGPGIPADARDAVLDAGVSVDADGMGLGLAIVADVADAHGWTVDIDEDPELGGARVEIRDVQTA